MKEDEREGRGGCNSPGKACRRCTIRDSRVPRGSQVQYSTVQYSAGEDENQQKRKEKVRKYKIAKEWRRAMEELQIVVGL